MILLVTEYTEEVIILIGSYGSSARASAAGWRENFFSFFIFFILNNINSVSFPISSFSDEYFTTYPFSHYDKMFLNIFKIFCIECDC